MATVIRYGNLAIEDVLVSSVSQETVFDEGGVDPIYVRTIVRISSSIAASGAGFGIFTESDNQRVPARWEDVKNTLSLPRQRFMMMIDGTTVLDVVPGSGALDNSGSGGNLGPGVRIDCNHGPRPHFESDEFIGKDCIRFNFSVDLAIPICKAQASNGYLSLRWRGSDDIDLTTGMTTRTYMGFLRVATKDADPFYLAKNLIFPPLGQHFRRTRAHFTEAPDGLTLHFFISDSEQWTAVPKPATNWSGTQILSLNPTEEGKAATDIRLRLTGPRTVRKNQLVTLALVIIDGKLGGKLLSRNAKDGDRGLVDPEIFIESLTILDVMHENTVEVALRASLAKSNDISKLSGYGGLNDAGGGFLLYPKYEGYDPHEPSYSPPTAGLSGIFICALQAACSPNTFRGAIAPSNPPESGGNEQPAVTPAPETGTEEIGQWASAGMAIAENVTKTVAEMATESHQSAAYLLYRITSELKQDTGRRVYAVAGPGAGGATAKAVKLHNGITSRHITIIVERIGSPPELPKPVDFVDANGIQHWVVNWTLASTGSRPGADGTPIHHVEMEILYKLDRVIDAETHKIMGCQIPYWNAGSSEAAKGTLDSSNFKKPGEGDKPIIR